MIIKIKKFFLKTSIMLAIIVVVFIVFFIHKSFLLHGGQEKISKKLPAVENAEAETSGTPPSNIIGENLEEYMGPISHIFLHSLIIYPEKALTDIKNLEGYRENMLSVTQFKKILEQLYENNFVLIDGRLLYSFDANGAVTKNKLFLPKGKRPLILSLDDLAYYSYMKKGGFANKLILENGIIRTQVITPQGYTIVTSDGDVVPIVDEFIKIHPDFSFHGARGIIGVTGFEGVLGYRTQWRGEKGNIERQNVEPVVDALKKSGWVFASHSYSHDQEFLRKSITAEFLANDISKWKDQVEPIVGATNIFIGPFGQVFTDTDPRRKQLLDAGFSVLYGVGMDGYAKFFDNYFVMNRIDIDGYRLAHNTKKLQAMFGISVDSNF